MLQGENFGKFEVAISISSNIIKHYNIDLYLQKSEVEVWNRCQQVSHVTVSELQSDWRMEMNAGMITLAGSAAV